MKLLCCTALTATVLFDPAVVEMPGLVCVPPSLNMALNCIVSTYVQRGMLPMVLATERDAVFAALGSLGLADPLRARIVRVRTGTRTRAPVSSTKVTSFALITARVPAPRPSNG